MHKITLNCSIYINRSSHKKKKDEEDKEKEEEAYAGVTCISREGADVGTNNKYSQNSKITSKQETRLR